MKEICRFCNSSNIERVNTYKHYWFSCKNCGSNYHEKLKPTKKNGICDTCGATEFTIRKDDSKDIVENRFKSYNEDTGPLIPYYKKKNLLCEINGMNSIEKVYEDIKKELDVY